MKNNYIKFLYKRNLIIPHDNVYYAEKAFVVNSVVSLCIKENNPQRVSEYLRIVERFLAGAIDIKLKDDKLIIRPLKVASK